MNRRLLIWVVSAVTVMALLAGYQVLWGTPSAISGMWQPVAEASHSPDLTDVFRSRFTFTRYGTWSTNDDPCGGGGGAHGTYAAVGSRVWFFGGNDSGWSACDLFSPGEETLAVNWGYFLGDVRSIRVDGDRMELLLGSGDTLLVLQRVRN